MSAGMRETIRKTVKNEDVIGFAELSGDHNPIHLSEHFARKTRQCDRLSRCGRRFEVLATAAMAASADRRG